MDAGPELDAEIARRVFAVEVNADGLVYTTIPDGMVDARVKPPITGPLRVGRLPGPYSTEIGAAWLVAKCFPEMVLEHIGGVWYCWLRETADDPSRTSTYECVSAPLAICRAALAALDRQHS